MVTQRCGSASSTRRVQVWSHFGPTTVPTHALSFPTLLIYFRRHMGVKLKSGRRKTMSGLSRETCCRAQERQEPPRKHNPKEAYGTSSSTNHLGKRWDTGSPLAYYDKHR